MALIPIALLSRKVTIGRLALNWGVVLVANLLGALFVAYVLAVQTGSSGPRGPRRTPASRPSPRARPSPRTT